MGEAATAVTSIFILIPCQIEDGTPCCPLPPALPSSSPLTASAAPCCPCPVLPAPPASPCPCPAPPAFLFSSFSARYEYSFPASWTTISVSARDRHGPLVMIRRHASDDRRRHSAGLLFGAPETAADRPDAVARRLVRSRTTRFTASTWPCSGRRYIRSSRALRRAQPGRAAGPRIAAQLRATQSEARAELASAARFASEGGVRVQPIEPPLYAPMSSRARRALSATVHRTPPYPCRARCARRWHVGSRPPGLCSRQPCCSIAS